MQAHRLVLQCSSCLRRLSGSRQLSRPLRYLSAEAGQAADTAIPPPATDGGPPVYPEKVKSIVEDISRLTLLETSQLNDLLKVCMNF